MSFGLAVSQYRKRDLKKELHLSSCVVVYCDVRGAPVDAQTVDGLARLQLAVRRCGYQMRLSGTSQELRRLIELMGLKDVLRE